MTDPKECPSATAIDNDGRIVGWVLYDGMTDRYAARIKEAGRITSSEFNHWDEARHFLRRADGQVRIEERRS